MPRPVCFFTELHAVTKPGFQHRQNTTAGHGDMPVLRTVPNSWASSSLLLPRQLILQEGGQAPALHSWVFTLSADSRFFTVSTSFKRCSRDFWSLP